MNKMIYTKFDVIVVGGGHAGIEAASAAARIGCQTLLLTQNIYNLGKMSCNPAIGGIGKGHLVKEIDALGGIMAKAIDNSGIQFKILNRSKGPAVRATRAQADRKLYSLAIKLALKKQNNLTILQQTVDDLIIKDYKVLGVITNTGLKFYAKSIVLTVGTFLNGKIYIGLKSYNGGRINDQPTIKLAKRLRELSLKVGRLKTGTPPRIDIKTINFDILMPQFGDNPIPRFSFVNKNVINYKQLPCYITYTNENTHNIIRDNINNSPIYNGIINGIGPRYCPSIEDKVMKFKDRSHHHIFLEPEGLNSKYIYPNGISTSLPLDIQIKVLRSIKGMKYANIIIPGYAIEYDFFDPRNLKLTLENKYLNGLFFAGQINGTTGYEEAAAQGLLAGINSALYSKEKDPWIPTRDMCYIGVLVDDLCTLGIIEPYRMLTSRAEYRLKLREDNADLRLTPIGKQLNLISDERWKQFNEKIKIIQLEKERIKNIWINPNDKNIKEINEILNTSISYRCNGEDLLRRPEVNYNSLIKTSFFSIDEKIYEKEIGEQIDIQIKYEGYINRQEEEINRKKYYENKKLPIHIDYKIISGLSNEVIFNLNNHKPTTIGQASRIPGITPAAISLLLIWLKKQTINF